MADEGMDGAAGREKGQYYKQAQTANRMNNAAQADAVARARNEEVFITSFQQ